MKLLAKKELDNKYVKEQIQVRNENKNNSKQRRKYEINN